MKYKIITISREFGSGGHSIGKAVAERLNIPFYDQILLEHIAIDKESCVIVGRCADYILHERLDCLHVFICADSINRGQRILERYGANEKPVQKRIEDKDARRRIYYSHYTDRIWGAPQNYHLCLNSSALGEENCIQTIIRLFEGDGGGDR